MEGKIKVFLCCLFFVFLAFSKNYGVQQTVPPAKINILGAWEFEKAEYKERLSLDKPYELKSAIEKEEGLYAYERHFSQMAKSAIFDGEVAIIYDLFNRNCGRYSVNSSGNAEENLIEILIGNFDEIGLKYNDDHTFNVSDLRYLIDKIDDSHIGITLEKVFMDDGVTKYGAVRCVLKKTG